MLLVELQQTHAELFGVRTMRKFGLHAFRLPLCIHTPAASGSYERHLFMQICARNLKIYYDQFSSAQL